MCCSRFFKKFVGPLTPSNRTNPEPSLVSNPLFFQISTRVLLRHVQLRSYSNRNPWLRHNHTQKYQDKTLMGLLWCSRLECQCSAPTLPVPHYCGKSHRRGPRLRHSGIQTPWPHTDDIHTNRPHCPWRDHTHMRLTRRQYHLMWQSSCCDTSAPLGHPIMGQTNNARTEEATYNHFSTYVQKT